MEEDKTKRIAEIVAELESLGRIVKLEKGNGNVTVIGEGIGKQFHSDEGLVLEIAEKGSGFAIYRDYSKTKDKLKRLER